ncbi:MAG: C40 family peptidase [Ruminiclostridium sp.]
MNKKLFLSCLVLSISVMAVAPIYKQSNLNSSNTVHPITEWNALNLEKVSSIEQLRLSGDTVTYPQNEERVAVLAAEAVTLSSRGGTTTKNSTSASKPTVTTSAKSTTSNNAKISTRKATTNKANRTTKTVTKPKSTSTSRGASTASSSKASALISTAKSFMGVSYVWGGTTPSGFDCSGFTQYVLKKNGISVPRTASEQYNIGTSVSKSKLRVGDLVFFTTYKAGASHLGFYIGNGNFIHASSSKGVTISSLSNTYYTSHYIGARRIIN